ncbi:MAG: ferredoxin--NADP reductase [Methylophilaceae bacterium]
MANWNTGTVIRQKQWNEKLFSLYIEAEIEPFQAGQFVKIALELGGEIVGRPYSLVNGPDSRPLELYYINVPNGQLTSALVKLDVGDTILVTPRAHGFMILDEIPQAKNLWLLATGTGVGPFLSMLTTAKLWQRFGQVILVYAVRTLQELSYQERISQVLAKHANQFSYVPFISREASTFAIPGRIPQAIDNGTLELHAGVKINASDSHFILCGNPQMIEDTTNSLVARGLKKHRRKEPGQITVESYW